MTKQGKTIQPVVKPILTGNWHGRDAVKLGLKLMLSVLLVSFLYLLLSLLLSFDSLIIRIGSALLLVVAAYAYLYYTGMSVGAGDAAFGEIMFVRQSEGKEVPVADRDRCYHPAKGFFAALIGVLPFVLIALCYAVVAKPSAYVLGSLPSWLSGYTRQSGIGDALAYYSQRDGLGLYTVLKVVVRSMTMPFINVAVKLGTDATLWAERLAPLWVMVAPLGYGFGYRQGLKQRTQIHTGIAIGDRRKKKRANKERKARQRSQAPERLI